jgi:hypothetical protein
MLKPCISKDGLNQLVQRLNDILVYHRVLPLPSHATMQNWLNEVNTFGSLTARIDAVVASFAINQIGRGELSSLLCIPTATKAPKKQGDVLVNGLSYEFKEQDGRNLGAWCVPVHSNFTKLYASLSDTVAVVRAVLSIRYPSHAVTQQFVQCFPAGRKPSEFTQDRFRLLQKCYDLLKDHRYQLRANWDLLEPQLIDVSATVNAIAKQILSFYTGGVVVYNGQYYEMLKEDDVEVLCFTLGNIKLCRKK